MTQSLRPAARPGPVNVQAAPAPILAAAPATDVATTTDMNAVLRPKMRPTKAAPPAAAPPPDAATDARFRTWIAGFRDRARAAGIDDRTFDDAFRGVAYDARVIARDSNQSEFNRTIWDYLGSAASEQRIANGRAALDRHRDTLDAIEARYGVEKEVVAAVWGLESAYGTFRGRDDVVQSLATLSFDGRRGAFFELQLIAALKILQNGDTTPRNMTGSWAGAMGHTQFMPTSFLEYAVDFTGDGRRDIWSDDPTDALASTAAYLARFGWTKGQPWGVEVTLPRGFDYTLANRKIRKHPSDWAALGVKGAVGRIADHGPASILLPAGGQGVALMIFDNFGVIERYNAADAYVIGVGHLSDRIRGADAFRGGWPEGDRALTRAEREELQRLLTRAGFDTRGVDGRVGPNTIDAVRDYQKSRGLAADGYASLALLQKLR